MKDFRDKVAAITGAGSGIGRALALELVKRGAHLALSDIDVSALDQTASLCGRSESRITARPLDVSDRTAVHAWADEVAAQHGRVNLVFNNAGVGIGSTLEGISYEDFEWIMSINFWGVVYGTKAFLPYLRASGDGHVVNISSIFGILTAPGNGAYNASKFAVRGFTEALRQELEIMGAPVSATCVHPGGIKTNIARASRMLANLADIHMHDVDGARAEFEKLFITTPEAAAAAILRAVQRNKRRVLIGRDARALDLMTRLLPQSYQRVMLAGYRRRVR